jgi:predicted DNA-binding transcriptional regulator AlpA
MFSPVQVSGRLAGGIMSGPKSPEPQNEGPKKPLLIDEKEAAKLLGFSPRTLQAWRVNGGGPAFVHVSSRCVRYRREDLDEWITERLRTSTANYERE